MHAGFRFEFFGCGRKGELQLHHAILHTRRISGDAGNGARGISHTSRLEIYLPCVQRAHNCCTGDDSFDQWATTVRATVFDSEEAVSEVENRNLPPAEDRETAFSQWNVLASRNTKPFFLGVHAVTFSIGCI